MILSDLFARCHLLLFVMFGCARLSAIDVLKDNSTVCDSVFDGGRVEEVKTIDSIEGVESLLYESFWPPLGLAIGGTLE